MFAFQDVMASLIGILFFIVLFMALDMVEQVAPAAETVEVGEELSLEVLERTLAEVRTQKDELDREVRAITEKLNIASSLSDQEMVKAIQDLHTQLLYLQAKIERAESELAEEDSEVRKAALATAAVQKEIRKLDEEIGKLKAKARTFRAMPRVAYIIEEASNLEPWLLEITGKRIRVAAKDGTSSVMSFTAATARKRREQLLAWAKSQNARKQYFVVLIKPSGFEESARVRIELDKMGFKLGKDLLPENWEPFASE